MAIARLRYLRIAPRKARIIADLVRGKDVNKAINELRFMNKAGSREMFKLMVSAIANAESTGTVDVDRLVVSRVSVDEGPVHRRWRPRAMGRATRVVKRTSHIFVEVTEAGN